MNSKFMIKLALSTAVIGATTMGCTNAGISSASKATSVSASQKKAQTFAVKAESALAKGQLDKAVSFAESAVEFDMQNRDYRALLARGYMAQGRFASAERTLMDVMELGQVDPRTVVSLALSRIALGKVESAVSLVEANQSIIPAGDYGLTLALAGQSKEAIAVLTDAIRAGNDNARTRQNLALAYAIDGRWQDARLMATQDMAQPEVSLRIAEWAQYARPNAYETRVAGLLNVTPRVDGGQPVRLALSSVPATLAQAEVAPEVVIDAAPVEIAAVEVEASTAAPVVELAAVGPAPTAESAPGFAAVEADTKIAGVVPTAVFESPLFEAPLIAASVEPVKTVEAAPVKLALADVEPAKAPAAVAAGTHIVQLGAFSNASNAQAAWSKFSKRYSALQGFDSASSTVNVGGKQLVRLAAMGFDSKSAANAVCSKIKAKGGDCIVKSAGGDKPVRLASAFGNRAAR